MYRPEAALSASEVVQLCVVYATNGDRPLIPVLLSFCPRLGEGYVVCIRLSHSPAAYQARLRPDVEHVLIGAEPFYYHGGSLSSLRRRGL